MSAEKAEKQDISGRYEATFGVLPPSVAARMALSEAAGRSAATEAIENLRGVLLAKNALGAKVQQLVHFAQLLALGAKEPARLHAAAAARAGATLEELVGVAETSLITAGMPAYAMAMELIGEVVA